MRLPLRSPTAALVLGAAMLGVTLVAASAAGNPEERPEASGPPASAAAEQVAAPRPGGGGGDAPAQPASGYVGQETCLTCHTEMTYERTPHGRAADARTPAARDGCESCHGPGEAHASAGGDKTLIRVFTRGGVGPAATNETCTTCHNRGEHALWEGSQHESRDLACTTCHSVHNPQSEAMQLVASDTRELCATCHRDKIAKLDRSGHMPVREGKLQCTTCHNPHGSANVRLLRRGDSIAEMCASCHADKRGPFLWEHPPARDGCTTCHDPHGSANERMLVTRTPILCQRCHVHSRHPSTIYDAGAVTTSARVYARSCVTCHAAIHGSNHSSGQRFLR